MKLREIYTMKTTILGLFLTGMIAAPFVATANSDDSYPAAHFQPTIIFADESAQPNNLGATSKFDANYPAANFKPTVLYIDASAKVASTSLGEKSTFDANYPAANFEPRVIYP